MHVTNGEEISSLGLLVQFDNVNPVSGIGVQFTRTLVQFPSDAVKSKKGVLHRFLILYTTNAHFHS